MQNQQDSHTSQILNFWGKDRKKERRRKWTEGEGKGGKGRGEEAMGEGM